MSDGTCASAWGQSSANRSIPTMAACKYPRIVEFRDSLPMTATGKVLKRELARQEQPEPAPHPVTIMMPNESVRSAPATATAGLNELSRGRVRPAPLQPELTYIHPRPITGT